MKVLRHRKSGNYYEVTEPFQIEPKEGHTYVCPLGGGFCGTIPDEELEEVEMPTETVEGWAMLDGEETAYKCEYNPHDRWNGWHQPSFTREVIDKITENWGMTILVDEFEGEVMVPEGCSIEEGICLIENEDGSWSMSGVCWTCGTDEELAQDEEKYDIKFERVA